MTPKISVVIPSFNKNKYISKTLESIVSQKYSNLEVIIQDGGSTDGTLDIIKKYSKMYPSVIKWESKRDKGQLDAIRQGLSKATGDIVTYINADDIYMRNTFLYVSKAYANNKDALWFAGQGIVIDAKGEQIAIPATMYKNLFLYLNNRYLLLVLNYLMQPSVFITKRAYKKYGPFEGIPDFVTEYDLWLKLSRIQMPVIINNFISGFRIENSTITKQMSKKLLDEDEKIVERYTKNPLILILHKLHNTGRIIFGKTL